MLNLYVIKNGIINKLINKNKNDNFCEGFKLLTLNVNLTYFKKQNVVRKNNKWAVSIWKSVFEYTNIIIAGNRRNIAINWVIIFAKTEINLKLTR